LFGMTALFSVDMTAQLFGMTALFSVGMTAQLLGMTALLYRYKCSKVLSKTRCHVEQSETPDAPYLHSISTLGEILPGCEGMLRKK